MKNVSILCLFFLAAACTAGAPEQIVVTATSLPTTPTFTPSPTETPTATPTKTARPIQTLRPTSTRLPTWEPVEIGELEDALGEAGYSRYPFKTGDGVNGFTWVDRPYEYVTTWEDGSFEVEVLHDKSPKVRMEHIEEKFAVFDQVMPPEFMAQLRQEAENYNNWVPAKVSGTPDHKYVAGDEWNTVRAIYFTRSTTVGSYDVWFSISWWQSTCPPQYTYCYYEDFPGLEFTGDSSFAFYVIYLRPASRPSFNSSDA